jgi:hypothetical protein
MVNLRPLMVGLGAAGWRGRGSGGGYRKQRFEGVRIRTNHL